MTAEAPGPAATTPPRWARKSTLVLATALLALAVFGTTTQTWIEVRLDPTAASNSDLHVQGSKAATAVTALALVALAGGLAASIAGRIARWIIAALLALSAAGIILAAATVLSDPLAQPRVPSLRQRASREVRRAWPQRSSPSWLSWPVPCLPSVQWSCRWQDGIGKPGPSTTPLPSRNAVADPWTRSTAGTVFPAAKTQRRRSSNLSGRSGAT